MIHEIPPRPARRPLPARSLSFRTAVAVLAVMTFGRLAHAQDAPDPSVVVDPAAVTAPSADPMIEPAEGSSPGSGRAITPLLAPIPFKNTQIGWGLALMLGAIHRFDPDTTLKPSTGAAGGFITENDSWGVVAMEMARLRHDSWRLRGMVGHMDIRYDFYGIGEDAGQAGRSVALRQTFDIAYGSVVRRFLPGLYAGPILVWMHTRVESREPPAAGLEPVPEDMRSSDLVAPGLEGEFDTRDDDYWPERGSYVKFRGSFFTKSLGSARSFQRSMAAWSWYGRMPAPRLVLATNVNAAVASGDAPFYALPSVGSGRYPLRGYTQGRYRDRVMGTAQAELRYHTQGRLGGTVFGGFGLVAPDGAGMFDARLLPAGGVGARYRLVRRFPLHMRLDVAWGREETLFYFGVGEAF